MSIKDVEEIELFSRRINLRGAAGMNMCGICVDEYVEVGPLPSLKLSRPDPAISQFCPVFLFFHSLTKHYFSCFLLHPY